MKRILLHSCCAPCGAYIIQQLQKQDYAVAVFFTNDNIYPAEEYEKRKSEIERYCLENNIEFIEDEYRPEEWLEFLIEELKLSNVDGTGSFVVPQAAELLRTGFVEGGKRCEVCFRYRLQKTAQKAKEIDYDFFGSTLSISPHKNSAIINTLGKEVGEKVNIPFLEADWKENNGFKCSCEISRANNFYRQNYCGCLFSMRIPAN